MRFLADSVITDATITATNTLSFASEEKLQIYQLADKWKASQGTTQIILDFGADIKDINYLALCGTNISEDATVTLSYSSTSPTTPEVTTTLTKWSNFNQVFMYEAIVNRRYWMIDISDPDPQGGNGLEIGYLSIGEYLQIENWEYPHTPTLNLSSLSSISNTLQDYSTDVLNYHEMSFSVTDMSFAQANTLISFIKSVGNTNHFVIVPYDDDYDNALYPPRYGVITTSSISYPAQEYPNDFTISLTHEERF